MQLYHNI